MAKSGAPFPVVYLADLATGIVDPVALATPVGHRWPVEPSFVVASVFCWCFQCGHVDDQCGRQIITAGLACAGSTGGVLPAYVLSLIHI